MKRIFPCTAVGLLVSLLIMVTKPLGAQTIINENAGDMSDLTNAVTVANVLPTNSAVIVNLTNNIFLSSPVQFINLSGGVTLTLEGNGHALDAGGGQGLVIVGGHVVLNDLVVTNAVSNGGAGSAGGGGGGGMGGALFVGTNASVVVSNLTLMANQAVGGAGGQNIGGGTGFGGGGIFNNAAFGAGGTDGGGHGGYGGGGGGSAGAGGFGGGNGAGTSQEQGCGGGGGAGLGGAIFVQSGGSLSLNGSLNINGNSAAAGAGGVGFILVAMTESIGTNGSSFGSGIFLQGNDTLNFYSATGQTQTIADVIADETGSGGGGVGATGKSGLNKNGPGTLVLSGSNSWSGDTVINGGVLWAANVSAVGRGIVAIEPGGTLDIDPGVSTLQIMGTNNPNKFGAGAALAFTVSAAANVPVIHFMGDLEFAGLSSSSPFTLTVNPSVNFTPEPGYEWTFLTAASITLPTKGLTYIKPPPNWTVQENNQATALMLVYTGPAVAPQFGPITTGSGAPQFTFTGPAGNGYRLWASTNLTLAPVTNAWTLLATGTFGSGNLPALYTDLPATNLPQRFYRITVP